MVRLAVQACFLICHDAAAWQRLYGRSWCDMKTFELTSDATATGRQNVLSDAESDIADCPHRQSEYID